MCDFTTKRLQEQQQQEMIVMDQNERLWLVKSSRAENSVDNSSTMFQQKSYRSKVEIKEREGVLKLKRAGGGVGEGAAPPP